MSDLTPKGFSDGQYVDRYLLRDKLYAEDAITMKGVAILNEFPAADVVEQKKGKWEHLSGDEWICNQCGFVLSTEGSWEHPLKDREKFYCEHCGADMREVTT